MSDDFDYIPRVRLEYARGDRHRTVAVREESHGASA